MVASAVRKADPLMHVSYYEADAYARWAGARSTHRAGVGGGDRRAGARAPVRSSPVQLIRSSRACMARRGSGRARAMPRTRATRPAEGALGEYNGKFMCNQYVLARQQLRDVRGPRSPKLPKFLPTGRSLAVQRHPVGPGRWLNR